MEGGGCGAGGGGGGEVVVELEDAVQQLVEHLVMPVLPRGARRREEALAQETQETVARQVHAVVLLYNYYHRKQFPQLHFADPRRFCTVASIAAGGSLLAYLNRGHGAGGVAERELSVTDTAVVDACNIAKALDATMDTPDMAMWPISKVAVLLVDRTKKKCLIERSAMTKGVWSIIEKEFNGAFGDLRSSSASVQGSKENAVHQDSEPYMLQQTAYSEVERKTGFNRSDLRVLEEHLVHSLSKKGTSTKLFVLQYEQTMNGRFKEMPLKDLIDRMSGPILEKNLFPATTCAVDYYHIFPYEKVLLDLLNREWPQECSLSAPKEQSYQNEKSSSQSEIDGSLQEQEANSKSEMAKMTTNVSAPKKNKSVVKAVGDNVTSNCGTRQTRIKRKSEDIKTTTTPATYTEDQDGKSPTKENDSPALLYVSNSVNAKATGPTSGGIVDIKTGVQMDKSKTEKHSMSRTTPRDIFPVKAPEVNTVANNHALESQNERVAEQSGGITVSTNDQMYALLQSLKKMRDNALREHCMIGDRSALIDMDIQTILTEGRMTPKVMSILQRYEDNRSNMMTVANSTSPGEGSQTMSIKRKRLKEAILVRNKCQELDEICYDNNWVLPRYKVLPLATDEKYQGSVYLVGPDFDLSADGDTKTTPHEARDSAASYMIYKLQQKVSELAA